MKIFLLTHEREIKRKSNTGNIAIKSSNGLVERIIWDRVNPNRRLLEMIESHTATLLYPNLDAKPLTELSIANFNNVIIIDATWQESRKIYNSSPYLKSSHKVTLDVKNASNYHLRRNQPKGGLCTIECIIEILKLNGNSQLVKSLTDEFSSFNDPNKIR